MTDPEITAKALTSKDLKEIEEIMKKEFPDVEIGWVFEKEKEKSNKDGRTAKK